MKHGITLSAVLHLAVVALAVTGLSWSAREPIDINQIIPVEIIEIAEWTNVPQLREETEEPPSEVAPLEVARTAPARVEPAVPVDAVPLPPAPRTKPTPPKPAPVARAKPRVAPRAKPTPPSRFDASRIAALLDKRRDKPAPLQDLVALEKDPEESQETMPKYRSRLEVARLTATLQDAIRAQIEPCWKIPAGAQNADDLTVKIRIFLNPEGYLARPPEIEDQARYQRGGESFFQIAAESARRAIHRCAPFNLPGDSYDLWQETVLLFDPSEMLGG